MDINAIKAEMERLQAMLAAQEAPLADEIKLDLGTDESVVMDVRAGNYEPFINGAKCETFSTTNPGMKTTMYSPEVKESIVTLNHLVKALGPVFKRPAARQWLFDNAQTPGGGKRYHNSGSANGWLYGVKSNLTEKNPDLKVLSATGKPETWTVDLFRLAEINQLLNIR